MGSRKSMPAASAMRASARQSGQLADQRSGTFVADRPDEQLNPNRPSFNALALCIATLSFIDGEGRSSKAGSGFLLPVQSIRLRKSLHRHSEAARSAEPGI